MTPRQIEIAKHVCSPIQRKVMAMREKYTVEEVAQAFDKTAAAIKLKRKDG